MAGLGLRGWPDTACFPGRTQPLDKGLKTGRLSCAASKPKLRSAKDPPAGNNFRPETVYLLQVAYDMERTCANNEGLSRQEISSG